MYSILTGVVPDFEECNELCRLTAPLPAIHCFSTSLDINQIIAIPLLPEVWYQAHGVCHKRRSLGILQPGFRVVSVIQLGDFVVSYNLQEPGALKAGYAGYIGSICHIYSWERLPTPYSNPKCWKCPSDPFQNSSTDYWPGYCTPSTL